MREFKKQFSISKIPHKGKIFFRIIKSKQASIAVSHPMAYLYTSSSPEYSNQSYAAMLLLSFFCEVAYIAYHASDEPAGNPRAEKLRIDAVFEQRPLAGIV